MLTQRLTRKSCRLRVEAAARRFAEAEAVFDMGRARVEDAGLAVAHAMAWIDAHLHVPHSKLMTSRLYPCGGHAASSIFMKKKECQPARVAPLGRIERILTHLGLQARAPVLADIRQAARWRLGGRQ